MMRRALQFELWPDRDRQMWQLLIASGDILHEVGPGARWRHATREILIRDYGFWLWYLADRGMTSMRPASGTPSRLNSAWLYPIP